MTETASFPPRLLLTPRGVSVVAAIVFTALVAAYLLFLRVDYEVIYDQLKPADAAAIVAKLDADGIPHRLRDGGTTILVPSPQADSARLDVAGSDIPTRGAVGFELFSKSDMGLTDFAQKINYQRALQGELERTIMMMDGIETARVHLALPERTLFRATQSPPKAAVELVAKAGAAPASAQVEGIQQLVAAAVADLPSTSVVVLDANGRVLTGVSALAATNAPDVDEARAAQDYYSARARTALDSTLPGLRPTVQATALPVAQSDTNPADASAQRDFQLRITVTTQARLNQEDEGVARAAILQAIGATDTSGDEVAFQTVPIANSVPRVASTSWADAGGSSTHVPVNNGSGRLHWSDWWPVLGLLVLVGLGWLIRRRQKPVLLSLTDRTAFAERLRAELDVEAAHA